MIFPKSIINQTVKKENCSGFALVASLLILVLLTTLLLVMGGMLKTELMSTKSQKDMAVARQHALAGMKVALGELQRSAGPDGRVTAMASIFEQNRATQLIELSDIQHPYYMGVFQAHTSNQSLESIRQNYTDISVLRTDFTANVPTVPGVSWMVSGLRNSTSSSIINVDADTLYGADNYVRIASFENGAVTDTDVSSLSGNSRADVYAGLEETGTAGRSRGRFAWWVSDESMKAKINGLAPDSTTWDGNNYTGELEQLTATLAQDVNIGLALNEETVLNNFENGFLNPTNPTAREKREELRSLATMENLGLFDTNWADRIRYNRDDFTTHSYGLNVDVTQQRLKQDLTVLLETGKPTALLDDPVIRGSSADSNFKGWDPASSFSNIRHYNPSAAVESAYPLFSLLRSWYQLGTDLDTGGGGVRAHSPSQHGHHPVIMAMGILSLPTIDSNAQMHFLMHPRVSLWNPTDTVIPATTYMVQIMPPERVEYQLTYEFADGSGSEEVIYDVNLYQNLTGKLAFTPLANDPMVPNFEANGYPLLTFTVNAPEFAPGEVITFMPTANQEYNFLVKPGNAATGNSLNPDEGGPDDRFIYLDTTELGVSPVGVSSGVAPSNLTARAITSQVKKLSFLESRRPKQRVSGVAWDPGIHVNSGLVKLTTSGSSAEHLQTLIVPNGSAHSIFSHTSPSGDYPRLLSEYLSGGRAFHEYVQSGKANVISSMFAKDNLSQRSVSSRIRRFANWNIRASLMNPSSAASGYFDGSSRGLSGFVEDQSWKDAWQGNFKEHGRRALFKDGSNLDQQYIFSHLPRQDRGTLSLAELQHAEMSFVSDRPWYAVGNAEADPRIRRNSIVSDRYVAAGVYPYNNSIADISFLLNHSLFDRFFLSTMPQNDGSYSLSSGTRMRNGRMLLVPDPNAAINRGNLQDTDAAFDVAAANYYVDGPLNVNSTSVAAWKATLGGLRNRQLSISGDASNESNRHPLGRTKSPIVTEGNREGMDSGDPFDYLASAVGWGSLRSYTDTDIQLLAEAIVRQVKIRGPFLSLADFVNRRLVAHDYSETDYTSTYHRPSPDSDQLDFLGLDGAIGSAIKEVSYANSQSLNGPLLQELRVSEVDGFPSSSYRFGTADTLAVNATNIDKIGGTSMEIIDCQESIMGVPSSSNYDYAVHSANTPGYLTQADILEKIAPFLSVRGDTFTIRSYGESLDPNGRTVSRARCEAVVQRLIEPLAATAPYTQNDIIEPDHATSSGETLYGRKFKIISFRWINEDEV